MVAPGLAWLAGRDGRHRPVLGLVGILVPIATFVAITIMGSWFPGRSLMTAPPLLVAPMVLALERAGTVLSIGLAAQGVYGWWSPVGWRRWHRGARSPSSWIRPTWPSKRSRYCYLNTPRERWKPDC